VIKVLVVDDHTLFRQGIVNLLGQVDDISVVGEAGDSGEAISLARSLAPDVIVMDIVMKDKDGIATAKELRQRGVRAAIVLVTMYRDWHFIDRARKEGRVNGYVLKQDAFEDLVFAVRAVHRGGSFYSPSLASELGLADQDPAHAPLTGRERQILTLIAEGHSSQAIAEKLFLSIKTIETHRRHISQKLDLRGPADFTRYAIKIGLVQP
jgi:two-component system nitrate/nitrite response regulator NarL